jgi:hypothetical protein
VRPRLLFDKVYATLPAVGGSVEGVAMRTAPHLGGYTAKLGSRLASVLLAGMLLSTLLGAAAATGGPSLTDTSTFNSGPVLIKFAAAAPSVELVQSSNPSVNSVLNVTHVLELAPLNGTHPLVLLAADPASSSLFNVSQSGGVDRFHLGLNGTVGVRYAGFDLWSSPNPPVLAFDPAKGEAELDLSYQYLPSAAGTTGIALNWSIQNWPWLSTQDLLGLELEFAVPNGTGFTSCLGSASPTCHGSALAPGGIVWSSSTVGSVGAAAPDGTVATLAWNSTVGAARHAIGVTAGTFYASTGVDRVTLAIPGDGSPQVNGSATFLLHLPQLPGPLSVSGSYPVYIVGVVGGALLVLLAVQYAQRRDQRLIETL